MNVCIHFEGLLLEKPQNHSFPEGWEFLHVNAHESIFHFVQRYLNENNSIEFVMVSTGHIPDWSDEVWKAFIEQGQKRGACKFVFNELNLKSYPDFKPYLAIFDSKDLRMALDQNYRPNFEDVCEAVKTFGFPMTDFNPQNVLN